MTPIREGDGRVRSKKLIFQTFFTKKVNSDAVKRVNYTEKTN